MVIYDYKNYVGYLELCHTLFPGDNGQLQYGMNWQLKLSVVEVLTWCVAEGLPGKDSGYY